MAARSRRAAPRRALVWGAAALSVALVAGGLAAWLVFDRVSLPRIEEALGIDPPYGPWAARASPAAQEPAFRVTVPEEGATVVGGETVLHGTVRDADRVYVWVKNVNVPVEAVLADGTWKLTVDRGMLPQGGTTLVFGAFRSGDRAWSGTFERNIFVGPDALAEPTNPVAPAAPTGWRKYVPAPILSVFQALDAKVLAPIGVSISSASGGDINSDGVPDRVQSTPVTPTAPLVGRVPYVNLTLVALAVVGLVGYVVVKQPEWFRERQRLRFGLKRLNLLTKYRLRKREQRADLIRSVEETRGRRDVAVARENAKASQVLGRLAAAGTREERTLARDRDLRAQADRDRDRAYKVRLEELRKEQAKLEAQRAFFDQNKVQVNIGDMGGRARPRRGRKP